MFLLCVSVHGGGGGGLSLLFKILPPDVSRSNEEGGLVHWSSAKSGSRSGYEVGPGGGGGSRGVGVPYGGS